MNIHVTRVGGCGIAPPKRAVLLPSPIQAAAASLLVVRNCCGNGVKMELKTLIGTSLNTPVTRIQDGFKQGAEAVIIDGRNTGFTVDNANTVIERVLGKYGGELLGTVEIWTVEGIIRRQ